MITMKYDPVLFAKLFNSMVDKEYLRLGGMRDIVVFDIDHDKEQMWASFKRMNPLWNYV